MTFGLINRICKWLSELLPDDISGFPGIKAQSGKHVPFSIPVIREDGSRCSTDTCRQGCMACDVTGTTAMDPRQTCNSCLYWYHL